MWVKKQSWDKTLMYSGVFLFFSFLSLCYTNRFLPSRDFNLNLCTVKSRPVCVSALTDIQRYQLSRGKR